MKLYFPFPHSTLWKQVTKCSPQSKSGELSVTSLRGEYLHKLFGIIFMGDFSLLPHFFLYSDIYLHQYGLIGIYFMHWIKIQYCFCCSNCSSFSHWELFQNGFQVCDVPSSLCFLSTSLLSDTRCSRLILNSPFSALESAISPKSWGSF